MKKGVLILLGMFMMVSTVEAKKGNELPNRNGFNNYTYNNAVNFVERGIEFYIFTNGEFDFNTRNNVYYDYYGRRITNNNLRISRDFRGRIRSIGNVFINYDFRGNVDRIGNVSIQYFRGRLTNVGNLSVRYDRGGYPNFYGNVKDNFYFDNGIRINLNIGDVCNYNDAYFSHRDFRRNYAKIREDRNYYYYKANTNAKIGKRSKILRRRKLASANSNRHNFTNKNRSTTSYRKQNITRSKRSNSIEKNNKFNRKTISANSQRNFTTKKNGSSVTKRKPKTTLKKTNSSKRNLERKYKQKTTKKENLVRKRRNL